MAPPRRRYFTMDDPEIGVTRTQIRRMPRDEQLRYMTYWFREYFEDPANQTPYSSDAGGYQYIWGGPYDANDQIGSEFGGFVTDDVIEDAVREVERDAVDWAPSNRHPDYLRASADAQAEQDEEPYEPFPVDLDEVNRRLDAGVQPNYGDGYERQTRARLIRDIEELEFELPREDAEHGGIGHNQPPAEMKMSAEELAEARTALTAIKGELLKDRPDAKAVARSAGLLQKLWDGVKHHASLAGDEFSKNAGGAAGKVVGVAVGSAIVGAAGGALVLLGQVVYSVIQWLSYVMLPF